MEGIIDGWKEEGWIERELRDKWKEMEPNGGRGGSDGRIDREGRLKRQAGGKQSRMGRGRERGRGRVRGKEGERLTKLVDFQA